LLTPALAEHLEHRETDPLEELDFRREQTTTQISPHVNVH